ncbi:MAG: tetrathionate reductase family octaheme c-type cytochrome [Chloroflexota bacterium]|nr:tetrathionate reductase family octaheme c-type cytochrome [Chloroflexota bacterium]
MLKSKKSWLIGALLTIAVIAVALILLLPKQTAQADDPWAHVPKHPTHTDHTVTALTGPFETGEQVTQACLECHPESGEQMLHSSHFTWEHGPYELPDQPEAVLTGKKHVINNFCIGITPNWPPCTACHAGYGWEDENFDFTDQTKIDCLVCHDQTGTYIKQNAGRPAESVDLAVVAQNVGLPTRDNCGSCHFNGGGGDAVKHGDLDTSLTHPKDDLDVHMGKYDFVCVDCHRTEQHQIGGRSISVSMDSENQIACTDCHSQTPHQDERLNVHTSTVACQTCHIPEFARKKATKVEWDWSKAGQDIPQDPHEYLKIKGEFVYEDSVVPEYAWYNGGTERYFLGDTIDPAQVTNINQPTGSIDDPTATIWPFKVHHASQIYDSQYNYLLPPKTYGDGGYWVDFNWDEAARLGAEANDMAYSGEYDFAPTDMYWPITHMVAPKEQALQCDNCHTAEGEGVLDWRALGYEGDPMFYGGRAEQMQATETSETAKGGAQ